MPTPPFRCWIATAIYVIFLEKTRPHKYLFHSVFICARGKNMNPNSQPEREAVLYGRGGRRGLWREWKIYAKYLFRQKPSISFPVFFFSLSLFPSSPEWKREREEGGKIAKTQKGLWKQWRGSWSFCGIRYPPSLFAKLLRHLMISVKRYGKTPNPVRRPPTPSSRKKPPEMPIYQSAARLGQWRISDGDRLHIVARDDFRCIGSFCFLFLLLS